MYSGMEEVMEWFRTVSEWVSQWVSDQGGYRAARAAKNIVNSPVMYEWYLESHILGIRLGKLLASPLSSSTWVADVLRGGKFGLEVEQRRWRKKLLVHQFQGEQTLLTSRFRTFSLSESNSMWKGLAIYETWNKADFLASQGALYLTWWPSHPLVAHGSVDVF